MASAGAHNQNAQGRPSPTSGDGRLHTLDVVRGLAIISMIAFHACYDLVYIFGHDLSFFHPPLQDIWRSSISWTFLVLAGISCGLSKDNVRRALRYLALAAALFAVTSLARVDTPINFGIIFCMGGSTLIYALLERLGTPPKGPIAAALLAIAFVLCLSISQGKLGLPGAYVELPRALFQTPYLSWLGFPGPGFASGDYYPLLPYSLLFLAASACSHEAIVWVERHDSGVPRIPALEFLGAHPLEAYIIHQPAILAVLMLLN